MNIVLIGFKGCGKSTIGPLLAEKMRFSFQDLDLLIERRYFEETGEALSFRDIFRKKGEALFRATENVLLREQLKEGANLVLALGGGTSMLPGVGSLLAPHYVVYLRVPVRDIIARVRAGGWPAYLEGKADPEGVLRLLFRRRASRYEELADLVVENVRAPEEVSETALSRIRAAMPPSARG